MSFGPELSRSSDRSWQQWVTLFVTSPLLWINRIAGEQFGASVDTSRHPLWASASSRSWSYLLCITETIRMPAKAVIAVPMPIDEKSWYVEVPSKSRTRIISLCLYARRGRHPHGSRPGRTP